MVRCKKLETEVSNDLYDFHWEKCMFGYVIHSPRYTIRVWQKEKHLPTTHKKDWDKTMKRTLKGLKEFRKAHNEGK